MKKTFRNLLEGLSEKKERKPIVESDKNWSDSLRKIAKEKQLKSLSRKDRQTLEKIADMMANANESADPKGTIKVTKGDKVRYITKDEWNTYRQMGWKQEVKLNDEAIELDELSPELLRKSAKQALLKRRAAELGGDQSKADKRDRQAGRFARGAQSRTSRTHPDTIKVIKKDMAPRYIKHDELDKYIKAGWKKSPKRYDKPRSRNESVNEGTIIEGGDCYHCDGKDIDCKHCGGSGYVQFKDDDRDSKITSKDIKMAVGIANDPRYKGGNYSAAYSKISKLKKGLVSHPRVKDALRQANESKRVNFKKYSNELKEASPRADAMRAIKQDKDFQRVKDVDVKATADDMKLAKKNPIVQLRKILDYKGGTMEFKDKKKLRVKADEADALLRGFDALQKVQDKEKYQHLIGSNAASFKKILKIVKR